MSDDKLMVRRLVLDILKPFDPELHIVATEVINRCEISKELSVNLTVYEVDKLTQTVKIIIEGEHLDFDEIQLKRTKEIAEVWQKLLYRDLGFTNEPDIEMRKLGLKKYKPDISWEDVYNIAVQFWGQDDFSTKVFSKVLHI